jgi:hypothetical protein
MQLATSGADLGSPLRNSHLPAKPNGGVAERILIGIRRNVGRNEVVIENHTLRKLEESLSVERTRVVISAMMDL